MSQALSDYGVQKVNMYRRMSTGYGRLGCFHSWKWVSFSCQQHHSSIGCSVRRHWFGRLTEDFCRNLSLFESWSQDGAVKDVGWSDDSGRFSALKFWDTASLHNYLVALWAVGQSFTRIHPSQDWLLVEMGKRSVLLQWFGTLAARLVRSQGTPSRLGSANASRWAFCFWAFCFVVAQLLTSGPSGKDVKKIVELAHMVTTHWVEWVS